MFPERRPGLLRDVPARFLGRGGRRVGVGVSSLNLVIPGLVLGQLQALPASTVGVLITT